MNSRAEQLLAYLLHPREQIHALLKDHGDYQASGCYFIDIELDVCLPQRPKYDIHRVEGVRVIISDDSSIGIGCLAIRDDFPLVPHLNLSLVDGKRSICLYERSWSEESIQWSASGYVERIRVWMSDSACGNVHRFNQQLEPIIASSSETLVLPKIERRGANQCWVEYYYAYRFEHSTDSAGSYFIARRNKIAGGDEKLKPIPFLIFECAPQNHGVIHTKPNNLLELSQMACSEEFIFVNSVAQQIKNNNLFSKDVNYAQNVFLAIVVLLPKTRNDGEPVENVECRAFYPDMTCGKFCDELGIASMGPDGIYRQLVLFNVDAEKLKHVRINMANVLPYATPRDAALANYENDSNAEHFIAVGIGAIGSQVIANLVRSGYSEWSLVDNDVLCPHNVYRHHFGSEFVGLGKAASMALYISAFYDVDNHVKDYMCDITKPSTYSDGFINSLANCSAILDFTASISASRYISRRFPLNARRISVFLNPTGADCILLCEDKERRLKQEWLEANYYRACALDSRLRGHLLVSMPEREYRYGTSCRDVSTRMPQDYFSMFSGIASRTIKHLVRNNTGEIVVYRFSENEGSLNRITIPVPDPISILISNWEISILPSVLSDLFHCRMDKLPSETGGVLLGVCDPVNKYIMITHYISAPEDSSASAGFFVRGCKGLLSLVRGFSDATLGNMKYVGEWHSHPRGHDATPSRTDLEAIDELSENMDADNMPTIMVIVGDKEDARLVFRDVCSTDIAQVILPINNREL
jgi:hypothetical protein